MEIIKEGRKAKQYITDIKYSDDTTALVVIASSDGRVYLHESRGLEFLRAVETTSKSSAIRAADFSSNGKLLRLGTNSDEVFYYDIESSSFVTAASNVKDIRWTNPTVPYSWNFQGERVDYSLYTACYQHYLHCEDISTMTTIIVNHTRCFFERKRRQSSLRRSPSWGRICRDQLQRRGYQNLQTPVPSAPGKAGNISIV